MLHNKLLNGLVVSAALFASVTVVSAAEMKCGAGKCGQAMEQSTNKKCGAKKCGAAKKTTKKCGAKKCGAEKKTMKCGGESKTMKCGTGKCGMK